MNLEIDEGISVNDGTFFTFSILTSILFPWRSWNVKMKYFYVSAACT